MKLRERDLFYRDRAISSGMIIKEHEPFRVVLKQFWDLTMTSSLLEEKFARTLKHEPDGLIFQPSEMVNYYLVYNFKVF